MAQQIMNSDLSASVFPIRIQIIRHLAIQFELALFSQLQDQRGRELFGYRAQPELCIRLIWNVPLHVGKAISLFKNDVAVLGHQCRAVELSILVINRHEFIDLARFVLRQNRDLKKQYGKRDEHQAHAGRCFNHVGLLLMLVNGLGLRSWNLEPGTWTLDFGLS